MKLQKKQLLLIFLSGFIFSIGLSVSGMTDPDQIINFLSIGTSEWDPSMMLVMGAAILVYALIHNWMSKRRETLFHTPYSPPLKHHVDKKLILGAILFGLGWGLVGMCPAPALARLSLFDHTTILFLLSMFLGFFTAQNILKFHLKK